MFIHRDFIINKYSKWYYNLMESRSKLNRVKTAEIYYESHHIIPRSMDGSDDPENLVLLSAREHYIAHILLTKFTKGKSLFKMLAAWNMMSNFNKKYKSNLYEETRLKFVKSISGVNHPSFKIKKGEHHLSNIPHSEERKLNQSKNRMGSGNPFYGKTHTKETRKKMSKSGKGKSKGPQEIIKCPYCRKEGGTGNMKRYHFSNCKFK